ncbi:MAG TPA: lipid A export permease/ATP-binding protein MsbA [Thermodesulfobacteriota bacterium]|nr:lipid A export permease/ATP-binding protein MsbA [Thermodesulfobacteriota bacterium]
MRLYLRLLGFVRPYVGRLLAALLCMAGFAGAQATIAYMMKPVVDGVFIRGDRRMLVLLPLAVIGLYLLKGLFAYGQAVLMTGVGQRAVTDIRNRLYVHLQRQAASFYARTATGTLISRVTSDVGQVQAAVSDAFAAIARDGLAVLGLVAVAVYLDAGLAALAAAVFPFAVWALVRFGRRLRRLSHQSQASLGELTGILHETLAGSGVVRAFGQEQREIRRFQEESRRIYRLTMSQVKVRALSSPLMELLAAVGIAAVIYLGGSRVIAGSSTPGTFFAFLTALLSLYEPIKRIAQSNAAVQAALAAAERIFELLDLPPEVTEKPGARPLAPMREAIAFERVSFRYDTAWVLREIDLTIRAGEVVAIVGPSGSGKSTLVSLVPRFYDVTAGRITIDGVDIRDVTLASLRGQIAMVTQQTFLFNDTVGGNIAYGAREPLPPDHPRVVAAARAANAHEFIMRLPQGYLTPIGEGGVRLSGGERQRIAIARALLRDAPILILDEATSALDAEAEAEVQAALERLMAGRTTLVIAHRLSTVRGADRIVVLVDGRIVESGTHEALLARGGEYRKLHDLALAGAER